MPSLWRSGLVIIPLNLQSILVEHTLTMLFCNESSVSQISVWGRSTDPSVVLGHTLKLPRVHCLPDGVMTALKFLAPKNTCPLR
jgi:hypothetical protein